MSGCDSELLEALIDDALGARDAARVRAHVAGCARCAREVSHLRAERSLFAARATAMEAPPPFTDVLAAIQRERRGRWVARAPWLILPAAAALALVVSGALASREPERAAAVAEPPPTFACTDDAASLAVEATAYATDRAVASAEDRYGACLMATPRSAPACASQAPSDVTCSAGRPLPDEVFESRTRGGSLQ
jgi:anti-sigma factor RsiW